jgi:hypothetical protein
VIEKPDKKSGDNVLESESPQKTPDTNVHLKEKKPAIRLDELEIIYAFYFCAVDVYNLFVQEKISQQNVRRLKRLFGWSG